MRYFFIVKSAAQTAGKDYIVHLNKALLSTGWIYFKNEWNKSQLMCKYTWKDALVFFDLIPAVNALVSRLAVLHLKKKENCISRSTEKQTKKSLKNQSTIFY